MAVLLNHTIIPSRDKQAAAEFLCRILGLDPPGHFAHFVTVQVANDVSLDFDDPHGSEIPSQHFAFLVDDDEFDPIFARVKEEGVEYYADPLHTEPGAINTRDRGRGFYFSDPSGHNMEVITRRYGSA